MWASPDHLCDSSRKLTLFRNEKFKSQSLHGFAAVFEATLLESDQPNLQSYLPAHLLPILHDRGQVASLESV